MPKELIAGSFFAKDLGTSPSLTGDFFAVAAVLLASIGFRSAFFTGIRLLLVGAVALALFAATTLFKAGPAVAKDLEVFFAVVDLALGGLFTADAAYAASR